MSIKASRHAIVASLALLALAQASASRAEDDLPVDIELVFAVDVSASMDPQKLALQRDGYIAAFRSPELIDHIKSLPLGRIAVAYVEWGDQDTQNIVVPWTLVKDEVGAEAVAAELEAAPLGHAFGTSISGALKFANALFEDNGFAGQRKAIDISGDGPNSAGSSVLSARDAVLAHGVTINGLPILIREGWSSGLYSTDGLEFYYEDCVIGGPGAFIVIVKSREKFAEAIKRKVILELLSVKQAPRIMQIGDLQRTLRIDCLVGEKGSGRILPLR
jgi:hypothetical protein